jgi:4-diphosphocytidyl-2-C-methyl-D-erythritol kinase
MKIKSFAKINLGIEILGKRDDGYHEIQTLFQTIDFYDEIVFKKREGDQVLLQGDVPGIPWGQENLIYQAAQRIREKVGIFYGLEIHVHKRIPAGAGLGGGSSNAAMTLLALNQLWDLRLNASEVLEIARDIGADVPYFLMGGLCLGTGRGDIISPLKDNRPYPCLLILPDFSSLTKDIYKSYQAVLTSGHKESKIIEFLERRNFSLLDNGLEETVFKRYPQLKTIKTLLYSLGAEMSQVSGTGSAVFGLFLDKKKAEEAIEEIRKKHTVFLVNTLSRELYWKKIGAGV